MPANRLYKQHCILAQALDQVGDRWTLLIVRELLPGPQRFADLRAGLAGVSPNVLAQRLAELQESGIVEKRQLPAPAHAAAYALSDRGRTLRPALEALVRWASRATEVTASGPTSVPSLRLLIESLFEPRRAGERTLLLQLTLGAVPLGVEVRDGCLTLWQPDGEGVAGRTCTLFGSPGRVADLVRGRRTLGDALAASEARVEGSRADIESFLTLFRDASPPSAASRRS